MVVIEEVGEKPTIHLGFSDSSYLDDDEVDDPSLCLAHNSPFWSDWDGGKIGGYPSWLNPRDLPTEPIRCRACADRFKAEKQKNQQPEGEKRGNKEEEKGTLMKFICQLYCPADDDTNNPMAFHRTLYVFVCPSPKCIQSSPTNSVVVLRSQMGKYNDFYPPVGKEEGNITSKDEWTQHTTNHWNRNVCAACGQNAKGGKCPKSGLWFCSREHQMEYHSFLKKKKKSNDADADDDLKALVYRETELVVEEEPLDDDEDDDDDNNDNDDIDAEMRQERLRQKVEKMSMFPGKDNGDDEEEDDDENLEQEDLNKMLRGDATGSSAAAAAIAGTTDPTTIEFYVRLGRDKGSVKDQCLRYCRWKEGEEEENKNENSAGGGNEGGPLWIQSSHCPQTSSTKSDVPPCPYCGAKRQFEFQIMPQMIYYLMNEKKEGEALSQSEKTKREALIAASAIADSERERKEQENGGDDKSDVALPDGFLETQEKAVEAMRKKILSDDNDNDDSKSGDGAVKGKLDWGVIAVYTCTASCGGVGGETLKQQHDKSALLSNDNGDAFCGYREEFAWRQPPL